MSRVILVRKGFSFVPADEDSFAVLLGCKEGTEMIGDLHGARNIKHLRKFWALAAIVGEALDLDREVVKKDVAIAMGFTNTWKGYDGREHVEAASIAVEKMTQDVFNQFFDRAVEVMSGWLGVEQKELRRRYDELSADKRYTDYIR